MTRNMDLRVLGSLLVLRENTHPPTDADWDAFLRQVKLLKPRLHEIKAIVFSDGGGPTAEQRKRLSQVMEKSSIHTAVISDKITVRFIISSIALFNKTIQTFSWKEVAQAYSWLGLRPGEQKLIEEALDDMQTTVDGLRPSSIAAQR